MEAEKKVHVLFLRRPLFGVRYILGFFLLVFVSTSTEFIHTATAMRLIFPIQWICLMNSVGSRMHQLWELPWGRPQPEDDRSFFVREEKAGRLLWETKSQRLATTDLVKSPGLTSLYVEWAWSKTLCFGVFFDGGKTACEAHNRS